MGLMDLAQLGARQKVGTKIIDFGVYFPWITAVNGFSVAVKLIHENDQFIESIPELSFPMAQASTHPVYGAYWSLNLDLAKVAAPPRSSWGKPGQYLYRFEVSDKNRNKVIDWVIDPYAREYGAGKMSAFTLDYQPHVWSAAEKNWKTPRLHDLVVYELHLGEFNNGLQGAIDRLDYLADLGVNCLEIMPVSNVVESVEWGFQPIGYFGVDDRFGKRSDMQSLVDAAHQRGMAVILDVVFGHTGDNFPYWLLYSALGFQDNPFYGSTFGKEFGFGRHTDFSKPIVVDFFQTVCMHLLECFHVDGFRYDCVPEYWDPIQMRGYHNLVYSLYQTTKSRLASSDWSRFAGADGAINLIQCAEQLECPRDAVTNTYGNSAWQNSTYGAASAVANSSGDARGNALRDLGFNLGLQGYPRSLSMNGDLISKSAFQFIENHDHPRFVNYFGVQGDGLFASGNRDLWYKVQPYLLSLLLADGIPMLWQGQELCENNALPDSGLGRVRFFRPVCWEYFYDAPGKGVLDLVRALLSLRKQGEQFRNGDYYFYNDWYNYLSRGVLLYRRTLGDVDSYVAVNFGDADQTVYIPFGRPGNYREELHGEVRLANVAAGEWRRVVIPGNYGRVWTRET